MLRSKTVEERAVSPVVGVILMVAITVILAAVIGAFVLDLGSNQTAPPRAGISFKQTTVGSSVPAVEVTLTDPGNVESLTVQEAGASNSTTLSTSAGSVVTVCQNGATASACDFTVSSSNTGTLQVVGTNSGQSGVVSTYEYNLS